MKLIKIFAITLIGFLAILAIGCTNGDNQEEHRHTYVDGVCSVCGEECPHEEFLYGYCSVCGISRMEVCDHEFENGVCVICDYHCPHNEFENGKCKVCGKNQQEVCTHEFVDTVCVKCGYQCPHDSFTDGKCSACGVDQVSVCTHRFYNGVCTKCGYECVHEYVEGECVTCGYKCKHPTNTHGVCDVCGVNVQSTCEHYYVDGICTKCEYECTHDMIVDGYCVECGSFYQDVCKHAFKNGTCSLCGFVCKHEGVACGKKCDYCNYVVQHRYFGGVCMNCGKEGFSAKAIPTNLLDPDVPLKGTVEKTVFTSWDYANNRPYENTFFVYLPYGYYKTDIEYDVLYLLHGSGENSAYWLAQLGYAGGYTEKTKVVLDNLIFNGICKPTIVVTPTQRLNGTNLFHQELINNIMPLAETKYRTKAHLYGKNVKDVAAADFVASRNYRAFAGLSQGSIIAWRVMAYELPYFSWFGMYSGGGYAGMDPLKETLYSSKSAAYKINFAYNSCGTNDSMYQEHLNDYNDILKNGNNRLIDGYNCCFLKKPGFSHNYEAWILDLYNSLGYAFFKERK